MHSVTGMGPREILYELPYAHGHQYETLAFEWKGVRMYRKGSQHDAILNQFRQVIGEL